MASVGFHLNCGHRKVSVTCHACVACARCWQLNEVSALARHTRTIIKLPNKFRVEKNYISFPRSAFDVRCVWHLKCTRFRLTVRLEIRVDAAKHGLMNRSSSLRFTFFDSECVVRFMCVERMCAFGGCHGISVCFGFVASVLFFSLLFCHPTTTH